MPDSAPTFDPDRFRRDGHAVVDWIADYLASLPSRPVSPTVSPGDLRAALPPEAPEEPQPLDRVFADLDHLIVPGLLHWQHPAFFGYFPASSSSPAVLGELLSAGLGVQGMQWATSPACTELEAHVLDWLRDLLGLPARFSGTGPGGGVIQDSASSGTLVALVAARERATAQATNAAGVTQDSAPLVAYASVAAHSSVEKAAGIAGIGREWLRRIPVDALGRMDATGLATAMDADAAAGRRPFFVAATVGTTACGAVDPVAAIAAIARRHAAWLHVDAAWAGAAAICPEHRHTITAGSDAADSWGFNPHKWLLVNFDCHALWVADRRPLVAALSMKPEYLRNPASDSGGVIDYCDWQVPLGRRFRSLKLWMTLRMIGAGAIRDHIRRHVTWAGEFAARVAADPRFDLVVPPSLALICCSLKSGDAATRSLLDRVNASGRTFLTHAVVNGRFVIRLAIGGATTTRDDVLGAWRLLDAFAPAVGRL